MPFLELAIPSPLRRCFDYLPPKGETEAEQQANIQPGMRVLVPFGRQTLVGVVLVIKTETSVPTNKLRAIKSVLDTEPSLSPELLKLCQWAANYYHHPIGDVISQALPPRLRQAKPPRDPVVEYWQITEAGTTFDPSELGRAKKQISLLTLFQGEQKLSRDQLKADGFSTNLLKPLIEKGLICETSSPLPPVRHTQTPPQLNDEQQVAVDAVSEKLGQFAPFLLEGITGSGKTEVYLQLIAACIAQGRQALVLIPEIGLGPQTFSRFEQRFLEPMALLHSAMNDGDRLRGWQAAKSGSAQIVIGTRSAILADLPNLGLIIVDEEHDLSYKQQDSFRYNARDIAVKRAADASCPVLLGSATPSLETLRHAIDGKYHHLQLWQRAGNATEPEVEVQDIRDAELHEGISSLSLARIQDRLKAGEQVMVFLNRRGYAPVMQCHSCGWVAECVHCDARMTVHFGKRSLRCHHCDFSQRLPSHCPDCGKDELEHKGPGTERLEMGLKQHIGHYPIVRIDRDTTANKGALQSLLASVQDNKPCVLVGTQMIAKGHHFPNVTLVVIVDIDTALFNPDFRGVERASQLLVQVAGRSGRAEKPGTVIVQTHSPDHVELNSLVQRGYHATAIDLLNERHSLMLPPASFMAVVRAESSLLASTEEFLRDIRKDLDPQGGRLLGPIAAPMTRKAGRYRAILLLLMPERRELHRVLGLLCEQAEKVKAKNSLRWTVDVDPVDLY